MRDYKFRAWDKTRKEMIYEWKCLGLPNDENNLIGDETKNQIIGFPEWYYGQRFIMMQFTGLKDKNGKEIYEEDILYSNLFSIVERNASVIYAEDRAQFIWQIDNGHGGGTFGNFDDILGDDFWFEVIGNIHENPELLDNKLG